MRCVLAEKWRIFPADCSGHPERSCPAKASKVVKDSEAEDNADPLVSRPGNPKRKTR
jgi:hypothetical protein